MKDILESPQIRIVLVNTSHPGNIGSAARAMKTMGLSTLYLVSPLQFPDKKAIEMASWAEDVLEQAVIVPTLDEAIGDCHWVIGTSVRSRTIPWPVLTPKECAQKVLEQPPEANIAIVFGREQSGLTNEELHRCHYHLQIPSNPDYGSLNLAAAVQVVSYELFVAAQQSIKPVVWDYPPAPEVGVEGLYQHLEQVLMKVDFLDPSNPRQLMARLRRLFQRTQLDVMELNILRGILAAIEKKI
jgi:tRNA (cytidine32/uridine32-2'-O)-methyltransferase